MPFSSPFGGFLDQRVDLVGRRRLLGDEHQVDDRDVRGRHADGRAVELALQVRQHQADRLGGAGRGRDHRQRGATRAAQVLVQRIDDALVAGVGVDRRHVAALDAERLVEDVDRRRQAVGRARRVGDDLLRAWSASLWLTP